MDEGSVPPDNIMRRLLMPYAMRCVPLFWRTEDVLRGHSGVYRRPIGGMKDDRVDLSGSLNGVSIRVRGNPDRARKAIASHRNLPFTLLNSYRLKRSQLGRAVTLMTRDIDGHRFQSRSLRAQPGRSVETRGHSFVRSTGSINGSYSGPSEGSFARFGKMDGRRSVHGQCGTCCRPTNRAC